MNTDKKGFLDLRLSMSICGVFLFCAAASAQNGGTITGAITDPDGGGVANAIVQAEHAATGRVFTATSSAKGVYTLAQLPSGAYDITVPELGFTFGKLEKRGVPLEASQNLRLDLRLSWGGNLGTPGDDPLTFNQGKPAPLGKPAPRSSDGKPDLSGVWQAKRFADEDKAELLPWAEAIFKQRQADGGAPSPGDFCLPGDPLLSFPLFYKIVQTPRTIVMMWEGQPPDFRQVFLDQHDHSKSWGPSWLGHSIAKWEGDTLVVDTASFNDRTWLGEYPHTEKLHVTEKWRRPELARLEKEFTVEDPDTFMKPWKTHATWDLDLNEEIHEYICNENEADVKHMTGKK